MDQQAALLLMEQSWVRFMMEAMLLRRFQIRQFSSGTTKTYCQWISNVYYRISGAGLGITGVTIDAANTFQPELTADDITFDANDIWINVGGFIIDGNHYFTLTASFDNQVPEPSSMLLKRLCWDLVLLEKFVAVNLLLRADLWRSKAFLGVLLNLAFL